MECIVDCKNVGLTCYNCGKQGYIKAHYQKPKKEHFRGKVFAFSGSDTTSAGRLIRGICFINSVSFIAIIDRGATYSFILLECVVVWVLNCFIWLVL